MANIGVLASGNGSNFQNIVETIHAQSNHRIVLLLCDKPNAFVFERATKLQIPNKLIVYEKGQKEKAESQIHESLLNYQVDVIVLAGFMRILSPTFIQKWKDRILNIHPALLPKFPGAHGIADSFASSEPDLGVTVHLVDEGVDTGPILSQRSFSRWEGMTLEQATEEIHKLEYELYPKTILTYLK